MPYLTFLIMKSIVSLVFMQHRLNLRKLLLIFLNFLDFREFSYFFIHEFSKFLQFFSKKNFAKAGVTYNMPTSLGAGKSIAWYFDAELRSTFILL